MAKAMDGTSTKRDKYGKHSKKRKRLLEFAKIWNDVKSYPANYDLERALGKKIKKIQDFSRKYIAQRVRSPELDLPELIMRRPTSGGIVAIPQGVIDQIDPFRVDVKKVQKAHTIVVTSHQYGANLNTWFWQSLMHYERARDACVVVMPIKYGPVKTVYQKVNRTRMLTSTFPDELIARMVLEDLPLCGGELVLNVTRMRPTLERFLTDSICEMGGTASQILAAPKLELEHRPRVGHRYPKAIMTTGACHYPNYMVDNLGQQDRTAEVATDAHEYAAIVIEVENNGFHFRQLHANKKGEFYDINPAKGGADFFTPKGVEHHPDAIDTLVTGDWHAGKTDKVVRQTTFGEGGMTDILRPRNVVMHDFIDCDSVSGFEQHQASRRGFKAPIHWDALEEELYRGREELCWIQSRTDAEVYLVASNHPEFVTDYIEKLHWTRDDRNLEIGARLFLAMIEDLKARKPERYAAKATDPIVAWFRKECPRVHMLERRDALLVPKGAKHPILVSMHGDKGTRGSETRSTKDFRKMNIRITIAHNHSGTIYGPVWRLGTSTPLTQFYVTSPTTNWTNTHGPIFKNGQRMLLNIIAGRWYGERQWKGKRDRDRTHKKGKKATSKKKHPLADIVKH